MLSKISGEKLLENVIYYGRKEDHECEFFLYKEQRLIILIRKCAGDVSWQEYEIKEGEIWYGNSSKRIIYTSLETLLTHPSQRLRRKAKEMLKSI